MVVEFIFLLSFFVLKGNLSLATLLKQFQESTGLRLPVSDPE